MDDIFVVESEARVAFIFGDYEGAAEKYAKAFSISLRRKLPGAMTVDMMVRAAISLTNAGREDDALDGLRWLALLCIRTGQPDLAVKMLERITRPDVSLLLAFVKNAQKKLVYR